MQTYGVQGLALGSGFAQQGARSVLPLVQLRPRTALDWHQCLHELKKLLTSIYPTGGYEFLWLVRTFLVPWPWLGIDTWTMLSMPCLFAPRSSVCVCVCARAVQGRK